MIDFSNVLMLRTLLMSPFALLLRIFSDPLLKRALALCCKMIAEPSWSMPKWLINEVRNMSNV